MYNTHYNGTLKNWKTVKKSLTEEDYNVQLSRFRIEYDNNTWSNLFVTINKKYITIAPAATLLLFNSSLKLLKEIGFENLIMDIKHFKPEMLHPHFVNKEDCKKIIISQQKYTSTNNSSMSIINLDLSKVKLEDLK